MGSKPHREHNERPSGLGKLEISVTPVGRINLDTAKRFADLGVDRLILLFPPKGDALFTLNATETEITDYIKEMGDTVIGRV